MTALVNGYIFVKTIRASVRLPSGKSYCECLTSSSNKSFHIMGGRLRLPVQGRQYSLFGKLVGQSVRSVRRKSAVEYGSDARPPKRLVKSSNMFIDVESAPSIYKGEEIVLIYCVTISDDSWQFLSGWKIIIVRRFVLRKDEMKTSAFVKSGSNDIAWFPSADRHGCLGGVCLDATAIMRMLIAELLVAVNPSTLVGHV